MAKANAKNVQCCFFYIVLYLPQNRTIADVVLRHFDLHFQGETFSCFAFAIEIEQRQWMSRTDLPRVALRGVARGVRVLSTRQHTNKQNVTHCLKITLQF